MSQRYSLLTQLPSQLAESPAQQEFRQALQAVNELREQLRLLRASQAATRQAYWQQVGPIAATAVAARRALYEPLEIALTSGYFSRAEEQQVTELLLANAHSLQERFGEDETTILTRYAPPLPPTEATEPPPPLFAASPAHEPAKSRTHARRHCQQTPETEAATEALLTNTKAAYYQLARRHHPDRVAQADAAAQQAQTAMMQRVTAAYAAGDLAALLALLATDEVPFAPDSEANALLQRYTHALAQQQANLRQQLAVARRPLENAPWSGTEKQQRTQLRAIKRSLRAEISYLQDTVRQLYEPTHLRQILRALATNGQAGL